MEGSEVQVGSARRVVQKTSARLVHFLLHFYETSADNTECRLGLQRNVAWLEQAFLLVLNMPYNLRRKPAYCQESATYVGKSQCFPYIKHLNE